MPRLVDGLEQILTSLGIVGNGYKLFFFETTTDTPKDTYSNPELSVANENPVECDAAGRPESDIWGADPATYKMVLGTPASTIDNIDPIVTIDPINDLNTGSIINLDPLPAAYWGTTQGSSTEYTLEALVPITSYSDKQCFFLDFHVACGASPTIDINEIGAIDLKKYKNDGTKIDLEANDVLTQRYIAINDGVDVVILNPQKPYLDGRNLTQATTTVKSVSYLPSATTIANNVSDANNDIDFPAGVFQVSDGSNQGVATAKTKRSDATWAAGTGNGGMAAGVTKSANTWYHCFNLLNPLTGATDDGFDSSVTATNLLADAAVIAAGFTKYFLVESIRTDGSANILGFKQNGNTMQFTTPIVDTTTTITTSRATYTLKTPLGRVVEAKFRYAITVNGVEDLVKFEPLFVTDTAPSLTGNALFDFNANSDGNYTQNGITSFVITDASSGIAGRSSVAALDLRLSTLGWRTL